MRLLLLTTVSSDPTRLALCERLIASINAQSSPDLEVKHLLLIQDLPGDNVGGRIAGEHDWIRVHRSSQRLSLSKARNILLELARNEGDLQVADVVAFPDDDAWYPSPFLAGLSRLFSGSTQPDIFVCRYSTAPEPSDGDMGAAENPSLLQFVKSASSNTMFISGNIVRQLDPFDEALGVGTALAGAEDLDYALRARLKARIVSASPMALVGHRNKSVSLKAKYYSADLLVLMRYAKDWSHVVLFCRKLMVGLYLIGARQLSIPEWADALSQSLISRFKLSPHGSRIR